MKTNRIALTDDALEKVRQVCEELGDARQSFVASFMIDMAWDSEREREPAHPAISIARHIRDADSTRRDRIAALRKELEQLEALEKG